MKFMKIYCFGRENGRANDDDFVVGYQAENGKHIEVCFTISSNSSQWYKVDGKSYTTLKAAKQACIDQELQWHAEWIPYMKAYRIYDPKRPQDTIAYVDDLDKARRQAKKEHNARIAECDIETMHVECY